MGPEVPNIVADNGTDTKTAIVDDLNAEGKAALRALFQTFIRRGTVDTAQLAKAVEATGYTDAFILESARRARRRLLSKSATQA